MLKQRLLTIAWLVPCVVALIMLAPLTALAVIAAAILLLCAWEWSRLIPCYTVASRAVFFLGLCLSFPLCVMYFDVWLALAVCIGMATVAVVLTYPHHQALWGRAWLIAGVCWVLLPVVLNSAIQLGRLPQGRELILYVLLLVWSMDIGAYVAGKRWGSHRLIPAVSPGKTREGLCGGMLLVFLTACAGALWFSLTSWWLWCGLALLTGLVSVLGDLGVSVLKRRSGVKDTGSILPGHGGVLDRLDSLMTAMPFFYVGFSYLGLNWML